MKNKLLIFFTILAAGFILGLAPAYADVGFVPNSGQYPRGGTLEVDVVYTTSEAVTIWGIDAYISYDANALTPEAIVTDYVTGLTKDINIFFSPGIVKYSAFKFITDPGWGPLSAGQNPVYKIRFKVKDTAPLGNTTLNWRPLYCTFLRAPDWVDVTGTKSTGTYEIVYGLASMFPNSGNQGESISNITIWGSFTNFTSGETVEITFSKTGGSGITVTQNGTAQNAYTITGVGISIASNATLGAWNVKARGLTSGCTAIGQNLFTVNAAAQPKITVINPSSANRPKTDLHVDLTGQNTHWVQGTTVFSFEKSGGSGITVKSSTVTSATTGYAIIDISATATLGLWEVKATTGGEVASSTPEGFTVTENQPLLISISPAQGNRGQTLNVTVRGEYTHFAQGQSVLSFSGTGITVNSVTVNSATELVGNITIASNATTGLRAVTVTTGSEVATGVSFTVTAISDTTPPVTGTVNDGSILGVDIDSQISKTELSGNWSGFNDPESGIAKYEYALGTTRGGTDVVPWTDIGLAVQFTRTGLNLTVGQTYYVTVRATNGVGLQSTASSDGVKIYELPPGQGINYPNPFNPHKETTRIVYNLPADMNTTIYIFDATARIQWQRSFAAGGNGGKQGVNEVEWNGYNDYGEIVGSGIYLAKIVGDGKLQATAKIMVAKY